MFTFKTYIMPLKISEERTEVMERLLAAFIALPDEVVSSTACVYVLSHVPTCLYFLSLIAAPVITR